VRPRSALSSQTTCCGERPGIELAEQMKELKRDVPIIVYAGMVPETMRHVDGFINKDEPVPKFLSSVHEFVKRYTGNRKLALRLVFFSGYRRSFRKRTTGP
jgi:hypothetical protein